MGRDWGRDKTGGTGRKPSVLFMDVLILPVQITECNEVIINNNYH